MKTLQRSWDILSQHLPEASIPLIFFIITPHLQAIHDPNQNGVSDLWEKNTTPAHSTSPLTPPPVNWGQVIHFNKSFCQIESTPQ